MWKHSKIAMLDFEGAIDSGVVEYGIVFLENGEIVQTETELCRPEGEILPRDSAIHGLNALQTARFASFRDRYAEFCAIRNEYVFAAHNQTAENTFLKRTWSLPRSSPDWLDPGSNCQSWGPWIDTLPVFRYVYPGQGSYGLTDLIKLFELEPKLKSLSSKYCPEGRNKPHCALYDALASTVLLFHLAGEPEFEDMTLEWLLAISSNLSPQSEFPL